MDCHVVGLGFESHHDILVITALGLEAQNKDAIGTNARIMIMRPVSKQTLQMPPHVSMF